MSEWQNNNCVWFDGNCAVSKLRQSVLYSIYSTHCAIIYSYEYNIRTLNKSIIQFTVKFTCTVHTSTGTEHTSTIHVLYSKIPSVQVLLNFLLYVFSLRL